MVIKQPFYYPPGKSDRTLHIYLPEGKGGPVPGDVLFRRAQSVL